MRVPGRLATFEEHEGVECGVPASVHVALAELLDLKGDPEAARRDAERAVARQPQNPMCLYFAGFFASRAGDIAAAGDHLSGIESVLAFAKRALGNVLS